MKQSFLILMALVSSACGASVPPLGVDGSSDVSVPDAATDATFADAGPCGPVELPSGYTPGNMHPPNPAHANACTVQQAQDYASCQGGDATKCAEFGTGQPAYGCGQCIESQQTAPHWGVVVFNNSVGTLNFEGCIDDALAQVPEERANQGPGSCGDLYFGAESCDDTTCGACTGDVLQTCVDHVNTGENDCAGYADPVQSTTGPCAVLGGDAAPAAVGACFPNTTITNVAQQHNDWLARMAAYMCGP